MRFYILLGLYCSAILSGALVQRSSPIGSIRLLGIYSAIETGNTELLKRLINENEEQRLSLDKVLQTAAKYGNEQMVAMLIEDGANVNAKDEESLSSMHYAALNGNEKVMDTLIKNGGNVSGSEILHFAALNKNEKVASLLIDNGANINAMNGQGESPTFWAAMNPNEKVMELFIKKSANVNIGDGIKPTALQYACLNSNEKIAELLIKAGANVNVETMFGWTPLLYTMMNGKEGAKSLCKFRLSSRTFTEIKFLESCMQMWENPVQTHADEKIIELLVQNGANINQNDPELDGITPWDMAGFLGDGRLKSFLEKHGAIPSKQ